MRDLKRKKGHLAGNKLLIKLDMTPRIKKEKNPFNALQKSSTTASKVPPAQINSQTNLLANLEKSAPKSIASPINHVDEEDLYNENED